MCVADNICETCLVVGERHIGLPLDHWQGPGPYYPQQGGVTIMRATLEVDLVLGLYDPWPALRDKLVTALSYGQKYGFNAMTAGPVKALMRSGLPFSEDGEARALREQVLARMGLVKAERLQLIQQRWMLLETQESVADRTRMLRRMIGQIKRGYYFPWATPAELRDLQEPLSRHQLKLDWSRLRDQLNLELIAGVYPKVVRDTLKNVSRKQFKKGGFRQSIATKLTQAGFFQPLDDRLEAIKQEARRAEQAYMDELARVQALLSQKQAAEMAMAA